MTQTTAQRPAQRGADYRVCFAEPRDDAEVRELLRTGPMDGAMRIALTREPSALEAAHVEGDRHAYCLVRDRHGKLLGMGSRSVRQVWVNGQRTRVDFWDYYECN